MEVVNETKFVAGWTMGFARDGRELLVVVLKGTFTIPPAGEEPLIADDQIPLVESDQFSGEAGFSAVLDEVDYAHQKPACDVLFKGAAYAPNGRPAEQVTVSLAVGAMRKSFNVVGDRQWERTTLQTYRPTRPRPFTKIPITYDRAFGGVDRILENQKVATYGKNPVGVGYYPLATDNLTGKPLPNTEEVGRAATKRDGSYEPMSLGPIGRNFASRYPLAGTYDQEWLDSRAPFWPDDFDYAYFQAAPPDQRIPYPVGGEQVMLHNLTPAERVAWRLPDGHMPFSVLRRDQDPELRMGVVDTVVIDGEAGCFSMTWRITVPLKRDCFEIAQVVAGREIRPSSPSALGKPRFRSIADFVAWKRERSR